MDVPVRGQSLQVASLGAKPASLQRAEMAFLSRVLVGRVQNAPATGIAALLYRTDSVGQVDATGRLQYPRESLAQVKAAILKRELAMAAPPTVARPKAIRAARQDPGIRPGLVAGVPLGAWGGLPIPYDYAVLDVRHLVAQPVQLWIVCDQLTQLQTVRELDWLLPEVQSLRTLALHRGQSNSRFKYSTVRHLLQETTATVWAPGAPTIKSLLRMTALPRLDRVCLPPAPPNGQGQAGARRWRVAQDEIRRWTKKVGETGNEVAVRAWWRVVDEYLR